MRVCVFGAGAIGGLIAARLGLAGGCELSLVVRGAQLAAIQTNGLTLKSAGATHVVRPKASDDPRQLEPQDVVILTVKAHAVPGVIDNLQPLLGPETAVLCAQNGIPWWYFHKHGGALEGRTIEAVDPGGTIWKRLGPERALGCVVWQAAELEAPGVVVHTYGDRMPIAEPSGEATPRITALSKLLIAAGIKSPVKKALRDEIWLKLIGNLSFNPVSVLTGGTLEELAADPGTRGVIRSMMEEARTVGTALGVNFAVGIEERIDMAAKVGAHKTSMLQDVEAGRRTELDALLGAVIELGGLTGVATPVLKLLYDIAKFRDRDQGVRSHAP
jgi:2-dehydropantoate 2-reductase